MVLAGITRQYFTLISHDSNMNINTMFVSLHVEHFIKFDFMSK